MFSKNKEGIKAILNSLFIIAFILVSIKVTSTKVYKDNMPLLFYGIIIYMIGTWIYGIYTKIQYRKGNADYLLIPLQNDEYHRISSFILGIFAILTGIIGKILDADFTYLFTGIASLIGALLLANGILNTPNGKIELFNNHLTLSGLREPVDLKQIGSITIYPKAIVMEDIDNKKTQINHFRIDRKWSEALVAYLGARTASTLDIRNNVV